MGSDAVDYLVELTDLPQSSVGAPLPMVLIDEHSVRLVYLLEEVDPSWDGTSVRVVGPDSEGPVAVVTFERAYWTSLGPPNDEAIAGHPLAGRGLRPYTSYRVERSSWIAELARRNQVHEHHRPESFARRQHFVFVFHDSTFECVAQSFTVDVRDRSSITAALRSLVDETEVSPQDG